VEQLVNLLFIPHFSMIFPNFTLFKAKDYLVEDR